MVDQLAFPGHGDVLLLVLQVVEVGLPFCGKLLPRLVLLAGQGEREGGIDAF